MSVAIQIAEALMRTPPQVATVILATLPVGELRGALPVALTIYKLPVLEAIFWSLVGNILPVWFLLVFFERLSKWAMQKSPMAEKFLNALYDRTRRKLEVKVEKYGPWALTLFVAVPLPVTGAWTGSLAAHVFGIPKKRAFWSIFAGLVIAAIIVTAITTGAIASVNFLTR